MPAKVTIFPVDNGDMIFVALESGRNILIDCNIRERACDPADSTPDVAKMLRDLLPRDSQGRRYLDAFLLTHPDEDHCRGFIKHFHVGDPTCCTSANDKILIREMWSSPMAFRRASRDHRLCDDAQGFQREVRRRVAHYRLHRWAGDGDRVLILGRDIDGKTDDLAEILVLVGDFIQRVNGAYDSSLEARLLAPHPPSDTDDEVTKNSSSVVLNLRLRGNGGEARLLTGGDAPVQVWENLWGVHEHDGALQYDLLISPHHCSWRSLSYDSWSTCGKGAEVNPGARQALGQALEGAFIVASSKPIEDDDDDPPCVRAAREYKGIVTEARFLCTAEHPTRRKPQPIELEVTRWGLQKLSARGPSSSRPGAAGAVPLAHG